MRYPILLVAAALLAGCAIDPKQREARETAHLRELARVCEKVGYTPGSEQNKDCVVKLLAAEMAQPTIVTAPYPSMYPMYPMHPMCHRVSSRVVCH